MKVNYSFVAKSGICIILMSFLLLVSVKAQTRLTVVKQDKTEQIFAISESGKVYFSDTQLIVEEKGTATSVLLSDIKKILLTSENTAGIQTVDNNSALRVYPNPVHDFLYIFGDSSEKMNLRIVSIAGKIVLQGKYASGESIDVSRLQPGFYLVSVDKKTFKLIKK